MTLSPNTRKKKSPEQIDRARERQRLARRAKRAAKARCGGEDDTGLEDSAVSNHSGVSTPDGKGNEGSEFPDPFMGLEENDVRRMISLEMSTLQTSHEQGLQSVKLLQEKEVDEALATIVWVLRASEDLTKSDPYYDDRWTLPASEKFTKSAPYHRVVEYTLYDSRDPYKSDPYYTYRWALHEVRRLFFHKSWPVAVIAMRNMAFGNPKRVHHLVDVSCKSHSLELWAAPLFMPVVY